MTQHNRIIFYDYDEVSLVTDCNFRDIPESNSIEDEITAYSSREGLICSKIQDTYLRLNRKSGEFFISHSYLDSSFYFHLINRMSSDVLILIC